MIWLVLLLVALLATAGRRLLKPATPMVVGRAAATACGLRRVPAGVSGRTVWSRGPMRAANSSARRRFALPPFSARVTRQSAGEAGPASTPNLAHDPICAAARRRDDWDRPAPQQFLRRAFDPPGSARLRV